MATKKLTREYEELKKNASEYFKAQPKCQKKLNLDGSITEDYVYTHWNIIIYGQPDTPYDKRSFHVSMEFPTEYPFKPPKVKFQSRIYHPNIAATGEVCIDILKHNWSPSFGVEKILLSILSLLAAPNGGDPLNIEAGALYLSNIDEFNKTAREY